MRFAEGPLDRENIFLGAVLVGLVAAHKCRYVRPLDLDVTENRDLRRWHLATSVSESLVDNLP